MTGFASLEEARLYREQWQPFGPWSDLECTEVTCTQEALIEDGRRMDACHGHLEARLAGYRGEGVELDDDDRAESARRRPVIDARDLSPHQRAWTPTTADTDQALREWPHADRVEVWDGVMLFENRWQAPWTWRSVAMAARAYPDRRVRLVDCYLQVPTDPSATVHA